MAFYRLLEADETIKEGDEILPSGIHYRFDFVPVQSHGSKCGKMVIRRKFGEDCCANCGEKLTLSYWCYECNDKSHPQNGDKK